jgi:uncharacterized protein (TIGR02246 family)
VIARYAFLFALLAGLSSGQEAAGSRHAIDMAAIEQLHKRDAAAAKKGDLATLAELWTDDAVALPPGEPPVIGIEAIRKWLAKRQPDSSAVEVIDYVLDFKEVKILGDEAIEWGRTSVTLRPRGATSIIRVSGNLMRVLKRQADGRWKVSRSAWNLERPVSARCRAPGRPARIYPQLAGRTGRRKRREI